MLEQESDTRLLQWISADVLSGTLWFYIYYILILKDTKVSDEPAHVN